MLIRPLVLAGLCLFVYTAPLTAQDFRVSTRLFDEKAVKPNEPPQPISRSWTIFHAGKVYDHVDVAGETIVFEPAQERFLILNTDRNLATELTFQDIETKLHQAQVRIRQKLESGPAVPNRAAVEFQLQPVFETSFDQGKSILTLKSPIFKYDVKGAVEDPQRVKAYLNYATWTARLNSVLQGQMLPGPRLALNGQLEKRKLVPTEIRLQTTNGAGMKIRAEHRFAWTLTAEDRRKISDWESALQDDNLRKLPFDTFQKELASN